MALIDQAVQTGNTVLKENLARLAGSFSYEETAYQLPIAYALTGTAVRDGASAQDAFARSQNNVLIAV